MIKPATASLAAVLALLSAAPAFADDIVVTGQPLKDTEAALNACIERQCPPDQDVAATLAHAENQFVSGDYAASRSTMLASLRRNRKHGDAFPVPVSDLMRANSRVAEHLGEAKAYQIAVLDMRDTLRGAFGPDDFRAMVAQIDVGDSRAKLGYPFEAERIYRDVEERALKLGSNRVATLARLRQVLIVKGRYDASPSPALHRDMLAKLDAVIQRPLPGAEEFVLAAEVFRSKLDRKDGKNESTDALVRRFAEAGGADRPVLLYSEAIPRIDLAAPGPGDSPAPSTSLRLAASNTVGQWADVGFWIGPDGHVTDLDVLRSKGSQYWLPKVTDNIKKRVYAPLRQGNDASPGFYMIERYTMTARFEEDSTGTRIRRREVTGRIERLDLTPENYAEPAPVPAPETAAQ